MGLMSGKFTTHKFWKNKGDCCDFIGITEVISDDGITAEVRFDYFTQRQRSYKLLSRDIITRIPKNSYKSWNQFMPRGNLIE